MFPFRLIFISDAPMVIKKLLPDVTNGQTVGNGDGQLDGDSSFYFSFITMWAYIVRKIISNY